MTVIPPPVNRAPVAQDDEGPEVKFGGSVGIGTATLTANDADADGDTLTVTAVSNPQHGTVSLSGDTITFEHDGKSDAAEGYAFTYTVSDGRGGTDTATVSGTVNPTPPPPLPSVNRAPVAQDDEGPEVKFGGSVEIGTATLTANDADADGDTLTVTAVSNPQHGTVSLSGDTITFEHDGKSDAAEGYAFTYTVSDGRGGTDTATVSGTVATDGAGLTARADALLRVASETDAVARSRLGRVNEAILPELSRALVSGALEAVERRIDASGGASGTAAGGGGSAETAQRLLWMHGTTLEEGRWKQALVTSSFTLNLGGGSAAAASGSGGSAGSGSGLTLWAGGDYRSLSGGDDADAVQWDGDVVSARVGLDKRLQEDLLAGLALSWSQGEIDYADRGRSGYLPIEGVHESEMLSVYPYVGWQPRENLGLWGALGYGTGDVTLRDDEAGSRSSDSEQTTAALGARTGLFSSSGLIEGGTTRLDLKGELWTSRFELDDGSLIDGLDADTSRVRLGLEGSHAHRLSGGGTLTPSVELGLRHDDGDGETGGGMELGGALSWTNPSRGLRIEGFARTLLAHEGEVDEWGAGGLIMYMPDPGGHGLGFSLRPSWGVTGGGMERLWESDSVSRMHGYRRPDDRSGRLAAEFGYGLGYGGGLLTPFGGLTVDDAASRYRFGALFELGRSLTLTFEAERRESAFDGADHGVLLRFRYWPGGAAEGTAASSVGDPRMTARGVGWNGMGGQPVPSRR